MESELYFLSVVPCEGDAPVVSVAGAMTGDMCFVRDVGPISAALARYAAKGGAVELNRKPGGNLVRQSDGEFALTVTPQAKRMIDDATTGLLAIEVDRRGDIRDAFLADRPFIDKHVDKIAEIRFQKQLERERKPMTLEQAIRKAYSEPLSLRDFGGGLRKDVQEFNPQPRARQETPPAGTSMRAISLAHFRQAWPTICQHLGAAMRANPRSREIADAGLEWASLDQQIGLGIDSRFLEGGFSVAVTPNSEALNEAIARSDKAAGGFLGFRKALTRSRLQPQVFERVSGQVVSRSAFSKAGESSGEGESETDMLRRHALEQTRGRLRILGDRLNDAVAANPDSAALPHLRAAAAAHREATKHINSCLNQEDED